MEETQENQRTQQDIDDELMQIQQDMAEEQGGIGAQTAKARDSQLKLFRDILNTDDSKKVANLTEKELGTPRMDVRSALSLALFCETQHLYPLSVMFEQEAEITVATSMGKRGKFLETIVTQIKKQFQTRGTTDQPNKKRWFQKRTSEGEGQQ
ncbi:hypothetical protein LCGC14_0374340 [marine sediment metagenome]|uniref:Uncharacterized protein n=1 Tax=marine sediment metagenome TaxID=412755 RepID=A0A0F9TA09_9ZZZZ